MSRAGDYGGLRWRYAAAKIRHRAGSQVPGIELGTAVVPTYPRHPAVLAWQPLAAALAVGPGRLMLGIGLSHKIVIEDMYGYSFDRPAHARIPVGPAAAAGR